MPAVFDRRTGEITERNLKLPLAMKTRFSASPVGGTTEIRKGENLVRMDNTVRDGFRTLEVRCGPSLGATLRYREPGSGVTTICPQDRTGFHHTYKSAGLPVSGKVTFGEKEHTLSDKALALLDWTASTPPRATTWNWAAGVGIDEQGRPIGINLSKGLVGGGYSQNTFWLDGEPFVFDAARYEYDTNDILGTPWRVSTEDGGLDLVFRPEKERFERINLGLVASSFHQPFGIFEGTVRAGKTEKQVKLFGFCEEHHAKW